MGDLTHSHVLNLLRSSYGSENQDIKPSIAVIPLERGLGMEVDYTILLNLLRISYERSGDQSTKLTELFKSWLVSGSYSITSLRVIPNYNSVQPKTGSIDEETLHNPGVETLFEDMGYKEDAVLLNEGGNIFYSRGKRNPDSTYMDEGGWIKFDPNPVKEGVICKYEITSEGISKLTISDLAKVLFDNSVRRIAIKLRKLNDFQEGIISTS